MGAMQRNKGARGERELLDLLSEELGDALASMLTEGEAMRRNLAQTRDSGADCICLKGWAIEVKRQESLSRPKWWRQVRKDATELGVQPMLAYRQNCKPGQSKRDAWRFWLAWPGSDVRELSLVEAAGAIREKWAAWP
jgi:hypothetical protein